MLFFGTGSCSRVQENRCCKRITRTKKDDKNVLICDQNPLLSQIHSYVFRISLKKCNQLVLNFQILWTSRRVHQVFGIQITRYSSQPIAGTKLAHSKIWNSHFKIPGIVYEYMTPRSFFVVWGILKQIWIFLHSLL